MTELNKQKNELKAIVVSLEKELKAARLALAAFVKENPEAQPKQASLAEIRKMKNSLGSAKSSDSDLAPPTNQERIDSIVAALQNLDHANDGHWTNSGLPDLDTVKEFFGKKVSRAEVSEAAPDFVRKTEEE